MELEAQNELIRQFGEKYKRQLREHPDVFYSVGNLLANPSLGVILLGLQVQPEVARDVIEMARVFMALIEVEVMGERADEAIQTAIESRRELG